MIDRTAFEKSVRAVSGHDQRIVVLGALLGKGTGREIVIVGGSAIAVYTSGKYVSEDIDLIGPKGAIGRVLKRWGFRQDLAGERPYWFREEPRLAVDIVRSRYAGLESRVRTMQTPYGSVSLAAPEDLILRRLIFAKHGQRSAMAEAELLLDRFGTSLDFTYLAANARFENVEDRYFDLLDRARRTSRPHRRSEARSGSRRGNRSRPAGRRTYPLEPPS